MVLVETRNTLSSSTSSHCQFQNSLFVSSLYDKRYLKQQLWLLTKYILESGSEWMHFLKSESQTIFWVLMALEGVTAHSLSFFLSPFVVVTCNFPCWV